MAGSLLAKLRNSLKPGLPAQQKPRSAGKPKARAAGTTPGRHPSPFKRAPICQAFMLDDLKVMYLPVAKNASSSLKRVFAKLGGIDLKEGEGIHRKLDGQGSGLLFEDRDDADIRAALADPDWMRIMVFRDPLDRLVSAYTDKFVTNRMKPFLSRTSRPVIQSVRNIETVSKGDFERGITFREFAEFVMTEDRSRQNNHWRPQSDYFGHICFTHIYDFRALDRLAADLQAHIGRELDLPRLNVTRADKTDVEFLPGAQDLLPGDLPNVKKLSIESFLEPALRTRLEEFYATDISIYRLVKNQRTG